LAREQELSSPDMTFPTNCLLVLMVQAMCTVGLAFHDVGRAAIIVIFDLSERELHYGKFFVLPLGGLHVKHAVQVEFGHRFNICSRTEENHGNLDRVDRSQDLPDAN
jgi:hypothetical protein